MSRYVHKIEISLVGIEHLSKEKKEITRSGNEDRITGRKYYRDAMQRSENRRRGLRNQYDSMVVYCLFIS